MRSDEIQESLALFKLLGLNLLFYFPTNKRSNSLETLMISFEKMGHDVHLMGMEEKGAIHEVVSRAGVQTHANVFERRPAVSYYLRHIFALRKFVRSKDIDIVYSHTQPANIVSVCAQFGSECRYIICRHHSDYIMNGSNTMAKLFDRIINRLAKEFIVPSRKVLKQLTEKEGVEKSKIRLINYAYDFRQFALPSEKETTKVRKEFPCTLMLVAVSRFIPCKRYDVLLSSFKKICALGLDTRLLILGNGPLLDEIKKLSSSMELDDRVSFLGYDPNPLKYMAAADLVVHTSDSEASNSVIKEAGLLEKAVLACTNVGDFSDYITHGKSGILVSVENTGSEMVEEIIKFSKGQYGASMGKELRESVLRNFSSEFIIGQYTEVLQSKDNEISR